MGTGKRNMALKSGQGSFLRNLSEFIIAGAIYSAFAIYLYQPYLKDLAPERLALPLNASLASLGCYLLSRRWIASFPGTFFAGIIYGFGPFALGLATYQATAGLIFAAVPWLFCPAAFWQRLFKDRHNRRQFAHLMITAGLSLLPFLTIILLFSILGSANLRLFPIPIQTRLRPADTIGLLSLYKVTNNNSIFLGFYHLPLSALVMGLFVFFAVHRAGPMMIFALGLVLTFSGSIFQVSPLIWTAIPLVCCSVLIGLGTQSLAWSTTVDKGWLLICAFVTGLCAAVTAILGLRGESLFFQDATMYGLAVVLILIIFFISRGGLRLHWLRWLALSAAFLLDILIGAQSIVETVL
jgi:hypothetical protein